METPDERILTDHVGQGDERHALMVREVGANDGGLGAGVRRSLDLAAARSVIERFVESESTVEPELRESLEILGSRRWCDEAGQSRCVGGDDQVGRQTPLESKSGYTECPGTDSCLRGL